MTIYKTLNGTKGAYGYGDYTDYLPHGKRPGKWLPKQRPILCESGYHVCRDLTEVVVHLAGEIYEVEVRGFCVEGDDKSTHEQMRFLRRLYADTWTETAQRLFGVDCARLVTNRFAAVSQRACLHAALDTIVGFAEGRVDEAAWSAAESAAESAARSAARSAAESAAWSAAESAVEKTRVELQASALDLISRMIDVRDVA